MSTAQRPPSPSAWSLALRRVRGGVGRVIALWNRSIQFRVVATTLVLSVAVMVLLGVVVVGQVRNGLLDAKVASARSQAQGGFEDARAQADEIATSPGRHVQVPTGTPASGTRVNTGDWLNALVKQLSSGGQGVYDVAATSQDTADDSPGSGRSPRASGDVVPDASVPAELRREVGLKRGVALLQYTQIVREGQRGDGPAERTREAGLVVGARLEDPDGGPTSSTTSSRSDRRRRPWGWCAARWPPPGCSWCCSWWRSPRW